MAKLATVKMVHKRTGECKIINAATYAMNIALYHDWKIIASRRGDADDDLEEFLQRQHEKELARVANPNHEAHNDPKRAFEARSMNTPVSDAITAIQSSMSAAVEDSPAEVAKALDAIAPRKRGRPRKIIPA